MALGTMVLRRFNGVETYPIVQADIMLYDAEDAQCLNLEIACDTATTRTTTDTAEYPAKPGVEVSLCRERWDPSTIVGETFMVDSAYVDDRDDWVSRFSYYEHEGIDRNVIQFVERDKDGRYHVRWTGETMDPNYYDGSKAPTLVEIDARFTLRP